MSRQRRSEEEQDVISDEVEHFHTESGPNIDAAQPDHREKAIAFWSSTEAETQTETQTPSKVRDAAGEAVAADSLILGRFLEAQEEDMLIRERAKLVDDLQSCFQHDRDEVLVRTTQLDRASYRV